MSNKLKSRRRRLITPVKILPYRLQKYSAIAGIVGTLVSLILSGWAIGISIENRKISTRIENMDTLLKKQDSLILILGEQSSKQNQINEILGSLYTLSFDESNKLTEQINTANVQLDFLQRSSRPNLVHLSTEINRSNNGEYILKIKFKNRGGREAKNVFFYNSFYKKKMNSFSLIFDGEEEDHGTLISNVAAGDTKIYSMYLSKDDVQALSNCYSFYKIEFFDPLYQSKESKSFYYKRYIENGDTNNMLPNNSEVMALQEYLKLSNK